MRALQDVIIDMITDPQESTFIKPTGNLIVTVRDYKEIDSTSAGQQVLDTLHDIVKSRRRDGQKIIVIGTTSSNDFLDGTSRAALAKIQSEPETGPVRTILTPCRPLRDEDLIQDHDVRVALINLRNLQDMLERLSTETKAVETSYVTEMLRQLSPDPRAIETPQVETLQSRIEKRVGSEEIFDRLKGGVWPLDLVNHIASVALGLSIPPEASEEVSFVSMHQVVAAIRLLSRSQAAKHDWMEDEQKEESKKTKVAYQSSSDFLQKPSAGKPAGDRESRMKRLRKICNSHERKLLSGVVDPDAIRTTFGDVRAPPETINALKTLTSLSLVRPDEFTYGVLATDKIPGLLLYGPPGTGKSLLARATAKESGATVLEVSGAGW